MSGKDVEPLELPPCLEEEEEETCVEAAFGEARVYMGCRIQGLGCRVYVGVHSSLFQAIKA